MSDTNAAVFGIYSTRTALEAAVDALRAKGFKSTDISVLSAPNPGFNDVTQEKDVTPRGSAGPGPAAAVGGALGWLVGMSALAMAGGVFIVAGPVMAALARMGETVGDITAALTGFGVPEIEAKHYEGRIASGGMLLSVHTDDSDWFSRGRHILEQTGAEGITATTAPAEHRPVTTDLSPIANRTLAEVSEPPPADVLAQADRLLQAKSAT
jgi:Heat induced stress protein YflT